MSILFEDSLLIIEVAEEDHQKKVLTFKGACRIENISNVKDALSDILKNCSECEIQFSDGAEVDLSAIQLIHALNTSGSQKNIDVKITGELPLAVADAFKFSGYEKFDWISAR